MTVIPDRAPSERFEVMAAQVVDPLRRYLARRTDAATAEDVLSETLLVCWRRAGDIPEQAPVAWAIGVARNVLANAERAGRRRNRLTRRIAHIDPPARHTPGPGESTLEQDTAQAAVTAVNAAMADVGAKDAEVLRLWAWEELTAAQIAVVLDVSVNAATVRLHRAKKRLRARLENRSTPPVTAIDRPTGGGVPAGPGKGGWRGGHEPGEGQIQMKDTDDEPGGQRW